MRQTSPSSFRSKRDDFQSDRGSIASALAIYRCLLGLSTTGAGKKECPDRESLAGQVTPFGDEERMSLTRTYVPAARKSVTAVTFLRNKGRPVDKSFDGLPDSLIRINALRTTNQARGSIMAKRKKASKVQKPAKLRSSAKRGKARRVSKAAKGTKRTVARAKPKQTPTKKVTRKVKPPVAPVVETVAVEVIEQPAPGVTTVTEVEETEVRKAS
jgi:hypothetical protein